MSRFISSVWPLILKYRNRRSVKKKPVAEPQKPEPAIRFPSQEYVDSLERKVTVLEARNYELEAQRLANTHYSRVVDGGSGMPSLVERMDTQRMEQLMAHRNALMENLQKVNLGHTYYPGEAYQNE